MSSRMTSSYVTVGGESRIREPHRIFLKVLQHRVSTYTNALSVDEELTREQKLTKTRGLWVKQDHRSSDEASSKDRAKHGVDFLALQNWGSAF